jgi:single-stranded DNA-binding protein
MNRCILSGHISDYGPKLSYTESAKPQTTFTLIVSEGQDRTFIPVLVVGPKAEDLAESLEPGDVVELEGKLQYKAGKSKDAGKLVVVAFDAVKIEAPVSSETAPETGATHDA